MRNRAISASRRLGRRSRHEAAVSHRGEPWFRPTDGQRLDAAAATEALGRLPLEEREVVVARLWGGLSFAEIAELDGHVAHHGRPALSERFGQSARKVGNRMSTEHHNELPTELKAFEAELAALVPRDDGLDHDRLMFLAGQASVGKPPATGLAWPAAFGGMTLVATTLAVLLLLRPAPEVIERIWPLPSSARLERRESRITGGDSVAERLSSDRRRSRLPRVRSRRVFWRRSWFSRDEGDQRDSWKTSYPACAIGFSPRARQLAATGPRATRRQTAADQPGDDRGNDEATPRRVWLAPPEENSPGRHGEHGEEDPRNIAVGLPCRLRCWSCGGRVLWCGAVGLGRRGAKRTKSRR